MSIINNIFKLAISFILAFLVVAPASVWKTSDIPQPVKQPSNARIEVKSASPAPLRAQNQVCIDIQPSGAPPLSERNGQKPFDTLSTARLSAAVSQTAGETLPHAPIGNAEPTKAQTTADGGNSYDAVLAGIKIFLREMENGITNLRVYLVDVAENRKEFYAEYDDNQGNHHIWRSGVFYDTQTQLIYGADEKGALALGFDFDHGQMMLYAAKNTWQRDFGFNVFYDLLAPAVGDYYQTMRVMFRYADMDWMVQFWKGQYAVTVGGEFGIYNKPLDRPYGFYDSATDEWLMPMSMKLYSGGRLLLERPVQPHWWMTGFKGGLCLPSMLRLEGSIEFPAVEMKDAFAAALETGAYPGFAHTVEGNTIRFTWQ